MKTDKVGWWEIWEKQKMQDNYGGGEMGDTGIIDNARMSKVSDVGVCSRIGDTTVINIARESWLHN